jgi:hypothetical protein
MTYTPDLPPRFRWVRCEKILVVLGSGEVREWSTGWTILAGVQLIVCDGAIRSSAGETRIVSLKVAPRLILL